MSDPNLSESDMLDRFTVVGSCRYVKFMDIMFDKNIKIYHSNF